MKGRMASAAAAVASSKQQQQQQLGIDLLPAAQDEGADGIFSITTQRPPLTSSSSSNHNIAA
jgi:hypothetical protein